MRQRHVTTAVTMVVLCCLLVGGAVWGWKALFADFPNANVSASEPQPSCKTQNVRVGQRVRSSQVQVSVFNGGSRAGLASRTLSKLVHRGFKMGEAGNVPAGVRVRRVQVWTTDKHDVQARLVARQFGRHTPIKVAKEDLGPGVDVVVGDGFHGLAKAPTAIKVRVRQAVCVPTDELSSSPS